MHNQQLLGIGELLNQTFQIYKNRIGVFLVITAVPFLFAFLSIPFLIFSLFFGVLFAFPAYRTFSFILLPFVVLMVAAYGILMIVISIWSSISLLYAIKEREQKIGIKEAFDKSWPKILPYWWISIISGFIVIGGYLLFIIPGIILAVSFSLAACILVSEDRTGMIALFRSRQLIKGYWWKVFWRFFAIGIIIFLFTFVAGFIPFIKNIIYLLTTPFSIIFSFLIYENLKKLKGEVPFDPPKRNTKIKFILIGIIGIILIPAAIITTLVLILLQKL